MKNNNFLKISIGILACLITNMTIAFTYQGELLENGVPVTGEYDLQIDMFSYSDPSSFDYLPQTDFIPGVDIENGLFTTEINFGYEFTPYGAHGFIIFARETSVGGAYTQISSLQYINPVPIATSLTHNGATQGQVLTYHDSKWVPRTPSYSPWFSNNSKISYDFDVEIGTFSAGASHRFTVKADVDDKAIRLIGSQGGNLGFGARLNFGDGDFVYLEEDEDDSLSLKANRIKLNSHTQQPLSSNGQIKFMVDAFCSSSSPSISKQYNGVNGLNSSGVSISNGAVSGTCTLTFPFDVSTRFYQVSVVHGLSGKSANCQASGAALNCARWNTNNNSGDNGNIMVLVY